MGYNRIITYGSHIEVFTYEKDLFGRGVSQRPRSGKKRARVADNGVNRAATLQDLSQPPQRARRRDHANRAAVSLRRLIKAQLGSGENPWLVTFTYSRNEESVSDSYADFTAFNRSLRHTYGKQFRYIAVVEFQLRGAVHFHALYWGLPRSLFLGERSTRYLASLWGQGFVYVKETDGDDRLAGYLSKYLVKAFMDPRLADQKAYVSSRNVLRPLKQGGFQSVQLVVDLFLPVDKSCVALEQGEYTTQWLGRCHYKKYTVKKV